MTQPEWENTHKYTKLVFWWKSDGIEGESILHDKTFNEGLEIAKSFGFQEPKWYKPWTWNNGVVTVG
jgi:hypothetical protein